MIEILRDHWPLLLLGQYPHGPLGGLAMTLIIAISSLALAIPFAVLIALGRTSQAPRLAAALKLLVDAVRCVPLLMFIFWAYFVAPMVLGRPISGVATMIIALAIYESAYLSEILRAGILALHGGQAEAARALGLGYWRTMWHVVLPQAVSNSLPSLVLQLSSTIKETSLAYIISAQEVTFAAAQLNSLLLTKPLEVFGILALIFFTLCSLLSALAHGLERYLLRGYRRITPGQAQPAT